PGPVPLRPMPPLTRPRAPAIRLAAPAEHRAERAPPEIPHPAQLGIQPRPLRLQPRQIQPISHGASSENEPISEWRHTQLRSTTPTFVSHTLVDLVSLVSGGWCLVAGLFRGFGCALAGAAGSVRARCSRAGGAGG